MPLQVFECFQSIFVLRSFNSERLVLLYNRGTRIIGSLRDANRAAGLGPDIDATRSQGFIFVQRRVINQNGFTVMLCDV